MSGLPSLSLRGAVGRGAALAESTVTSLADARQLGKSNTLCLNLSALQYLRTLLQCSLSLLVAGPSHSRTDQVA